MSHPITRLAQRRQRVTGRGLDDYGGLHGLTVRHVTDTRIGQPDTRPAPRPASILPVGYEGERMMAQPHLYHVWQHDVQVLARAVYRIHMAPERYTQLQRDTIDDTFLEYLDSHPGTMSFDCDECRAAVIVNVRSDVPTPGTSDALRFAIFGPDLEHPRATWFRHAVAEHNASHS